MRQIASSPLPVNLYHDPSISVYVRHSRLWHWMRMEHSGYTLEKRETEPIVLNRLNGECMYYQSIPYDFHWLDVPPEQVTQFNLIIWQSIAKNHFKSVSKYSIDLFDAMSITKVNQYCKFGLGDNQYYYQFPDKEFSGVMFTYTSFGEDSRVAFPFLSGYSLLDQISFLSFTTKITNCHSVGLGLRVGAFDSHDQCSQNSVHPGTIYKFAIQCNLFSLSRNMTDYSWLRTAKIDKFVWYNHEGSIYSRLSQFHIWAVVVPVRKFRQFVIYGINYPHTRSHCGNDLQQLSVCNFYYLIKDITSFVTEYLVMDDYVEPASKYPMSSYTGSFHSAFLLTSAKTMFDTNQCEIKVTVNYGSIEPFKQQISHFNTAGDYRRKPSSNQWTLCRHGHCYLLKDDESIPKASSWEEAEKFCNDNHGHLLSVNSDSEQIAVLYWVTAHKRKMITSSRYVWYIHIAGY